MAGSLPIQMEARVSEYLSLSMTLLFAFGLCFQLSRNPCPFGAGRFCDGGKLSHFRRYAIVLIFTVAAILTSPDVFSQLALAFPMMISS